MRLSPLFRESNFFAVLIRIDKKDRSIDSAFKFLSIFSIRLFTCCNYEN